MGIIYQMKNTSIGKTAAFVYQVLRELSAGEGTRARGYIYAGREYLAEVCRCSDRTVRRALRELSDAGLIRDVRMGRGLNNRIYLLSQTNNGISVQSRPDKSVHSQYNAKETNSNIDISIHQQKTDAPEARTDGQSESASTMRAEAHTKADSTPLTASANKGKPTPKRPRNDRAERRRAARARYAEALRARLFLGESGQTLAMLDDDGSRSAAAEAAIAMLSDGLSAGRNIKVSGSYLTAAQYWEMVQYIDLAALEAVLERVNRAENVRNLTGYTLASLYNECMWRRLNAS